MGGGRWRGGKCLIFIIQLRGDGWMGEGGEGEIGPSWNIKKKKKGKKKEGGQKFN